MGGGASDRNATEHSTFSRLNLEVDLARGHALVLGTSPYFAMRSGEQRARSDGNDPLRVRQRMVTLVSGIEYRAHLFERNDGPPEPSEMLPVHYRVENTLFAKNYLYRARYDGWSPLQGPVKNVEDVSFGVGDGLRVAITDRLMAKASYELATRTPNLDQLFGSHITYLSNPSLRPERSHNLNLGAGVRGASSSLGGLDVEVHGVVRATRDEVALLSDGVVVTPQNLARSRTLGVEGRLDWTSPGGWVRVDGASSYHDQRNRSGEGPFARFEGERIPNRPWLFASWGAELNFDEPLWSEHQLSPFYQARYVHGFAVGWESVGVAQFRREVPAQLSHTVGVTYGLKVAAARLHATVEVQNLTDALLYDYFGMPRPGRLIFGRIVAEL